MNHAAINALVAERVMGWRREVQDGTIIGYRDQQGKYRIIEGLDWAPNQFDPSRNIAHAMEVLMTFNAYGIKKGMASVKGNKRWCHVLNDDICIAICIAALRAKGVADKDIEEVCGGG